MEPSVSACDMVGAEHTRARRRAPHRRTLPARVPSGATRTKTHKTPSAVANRAGRPMLVVAFPRPVAIPLPEGDSPVGRAWLAAHGLQDTEVSSSHLVFSRL